jgi:hypothetical protein
MARLIAKIAPRATSPNLRFMAASRASCACVAAVTALRFAEVACSTEPSSDYQWQSRVIKGHQWQSRSISGHQWASAVISGNQGPSVAIKGS